MSLFDFLPGFGAGESAAESDATNADESAGQPSADSPPTPLAESFAEQNGSLDVSASSLRTVDELVTGPSSPQRDEHVHAISAYVGEVFVREYDGDWEYYDQLGWVVSIPDPGADDDMVLTLPNVMADVLEGDVSFGMVHDQFVDELGLDGPELTGPGPEDGQAQADSPLSEAEVDERAERAERIAAQGEEYDLDFTPASFARLDDLIAAVYDQSPDDVDRDELAAESPPGGVPEGASLRIGSGGATDQIAAYVGEVYRRSYGAEWHDGGAFDAIAISGANGTAELEPQMLTSAAFVGHVSFARTHEAVAADLGLTD